MSAEDASVRVGVLALHNSKETKAILNAVEDLGHEPVWLRDENTTIDVTDGVATLEPEVDVIANRLLLSSTGQPCEDLGLARTLADLKPMLNRPEAALVALHKFAAATTLAREGLKVPDAVLSLSSDTLNGMRDRYGAEAVYKTAIGTHGGGTWKVGADELLNARVGNRRAFLQRLIERDGDRHRDLRVYVVGDRVLGAMNRYAPEGDWRTNVALGGDVEDASERMPDEVRKTAVRAREVIGLDYAGVDLVEGEDGWFILEVNPTAGFKGLYKATGLSPAPFIAQHAIERVGGTVSEERVREIAATLDDTDPTGLPPRRTTESTEPVVIGYTEEVVVSGTSGSKSVMAKSDTGATRTSMDTKLAAEIGAGPIKSITRVKSGSLKGGKSRPVVDLVVGVGGNHHTVTASIEDRGHMDYPLLLGRDILENYQVDVRKRADAPDEESDEEEE